MKISDDARQCVVFLGDCEPSGDPATFVPYATAFFLRVGTMTDWVYLVTARHNVVDESQPFWVRFNGRYGGATVMLIESPKWAFHDDRTVDVAVMEFPNVGEGRDCPFFSAWSHSSIVTKRWHERDFGPGDLTYTVGLFAYHRGEARNIPLVHTGHIAAFYEDDKIRIRDWRISADRKHVLVDAYVVQSAVLPGASGSPVFVRETMPCAGQKHVHMQQRLDANSRWGTPTSEAEHHDMPTAYGDLYLLGLWHGSWQADDIHTASGSIVRSPAGYGIVVPADRIREVLDSSELNDRRQRSEAARLALKATGGERT